MSYFVAVLPTVPPSANNLYTTQLKINWSQLWVALKSGNKQLVMRSITPYRILSKAGKEWKDQAYHRIRSAINEYEWKAEPKTPLRVEVVFTHPYILRWDVAGKEKALLDALAQAIEIDDRYVMQLELIKQKGEEHVRMTVSHYS